MVTEKDICVLASLMRDGGCADIALALEMALFDANDDSLGENEATASADVDQADLSLGSLSLGMPKVSFETKEKYRVLASSLLANSDYGVRREARKLLKALS
jgi:hypothetical protein